MEEDIWNNLLSLLPLHPNFTSAEYDDALKGMSTTKKGHLQVASHTGLETCRRQSSNLQSQGRNVHFPPRCKMLAVTQN